MTATPETAWRSEFGITAHRSPDFLASKDDLDSREVSVPHAHVLRRAFELLGLDGVLCDQTAPLVYFKVVRRILPTELQELHRQFWNHGGAPILAVVTPN